MAIRPVNRAQRIMFWTALFGASLTSLGYARTLSESDYRHIVEFQDPALSPDGRYSATIISRVVWNEDRRIHSLFIARTRGVAWTRELLVGRKGLSSPQFSPDASQLAILLNDSAGRAQIYVMPSAGGPVRQVTHSATDIDAFAWRPDGRAFAYTASPPAPHRSGPDRFRDSFIFTTEPITARSKPQPLHVFVQQINSSHATQLTFGERSGISGGPLSWSPDGRRIGFVLCPTNITDDEDRSQVAAVDVASRRLTLMTTHRAWEGTPLFSPDGKRFAFTYSGGDPQFSLNQLYVTGSRGGDGT
ncbi:MAG: PD40 domain-containing protein, partial [Candidatus Eremiobacteraeota bacterium]|nr:PD40 domain-containing protein [Candidatus Eremiobacteraeota bacterium]